MHMTTNEKTNDFFTQYTPHTYASGEVLLRPGDDERAIYIEKGIVVQYDISATGEKLIVNIYKAGAFVPLPSIVAAVPVEFFYEASGEAVVRVAPTKDVHRFLLRNGDVSHDTLVRLARGSNGILKRVARMMEGGAEVRILHELEVLQQRFPSDDGSIKITVIQLSEQTGLARETVSRALSRLQSQGLVAKRRGELRLTPPHR